MSAVLLPSAIYDLFYDDYTTGKSFLHSHTFGGNALAAAVALECLSVFEEENIYSTVRNQEPFLNQLMQEIAQSTQSLKNVRCIGAIVAADLVLTPEQEQQRCGFQVFQRAVKLGALLRPLGNTLYWLPPLNIDKATLVQLQSITAQAIEETLMTL